MVIVLRLLQYKFQLFVCLLLSELSLNLFYDLFSSTEYYIQKRCCLPYHQSPRSHLHWGRCLSEFLPALPSSVSPRAASLWTPSAPQRWSVHHRHSQTKRGREECRVYEEVILFMGWKKMQGNDVLMFVGFCSLFNVHFKVSSLWREL